jgi:phytoene dehydrogenase-like protein
VTAATGKANRYDCIVIGGGHNGLICAAYLAKAGRSVVVLERRHVVGGAAVTEELYPGFRYTVCSYVVSLLRPWIVRDLNLAKHGLELYPLEASYAPDREGPGLCRWPDPYQTFDEIARYSKADAERYQEFGKAMSKLARVAKPIIDSPAPLPTSFWPSDILQLGRLGRHAAGLPDALADEQLRLATMSAADYLDRWFESDRLKAPMSCSGIIGTMLGVRSPGTAYVLLHHYMGEIDGSSRAWGFAKGGNGAVSEAIASSARSFGVEIRTNTTVDHVMIKNGAATGVVLSDGEEIYANTVVSGCEPKLTFSKFVGEEHLPDEFNQAIRKYKLRGSSGKVNIALDGFPDFKGRPGIGNHVRGDIAIAPSIGYLEDAYDEAKWGSYSSRPYINLVVPSLLDPTMAPPGKHVFSCFVQYAPYHLAEGPEAWPKHRDGFGEAVISTLEEYCPSIRDRILHMQVLSPWDLEQEFGLTEGNIFHGELSLDQLLFQRPAPGWARFKTPVRGLWLGSSGAHPGGGVMGAPGALAAQAILASGGA